MLTEEEQAALEIRRDYRKLFPRTEDSGLYPAIVLADAMLRLYPHGHADEITPDRLVVCGGRSACEHQDEIQFGSQLDRYVVFDYSVKGDFMWFVNHRCVHPIAAPRNMGEVWQLLARCGIPVKKGGEA